LIDFVFSNVDAILILELIPVSGFLALVFTKNASRKTWAIYFSRVALFVWVIASATLYYVASHSVFHCGRGCCDHVISSKQLKQELLAQSNQRFSI